MFVLYNLALFAASPVLVGMLASRLLRGKSRAGWGERWGRIAGAVAPKTARRVWVHGASVGEMTVAAPILKAYKSLRPDDDIVISAITPGGYETAASMMGSVASGVFYAPFDLPGPVSRAVRTVQPDLLLVLETELWGNLLHYANASGAKLVLANARISDKSYGAYLRFRPVFAWALSQFHRVLAQSATDRDRLAALGAPGDRLALFGNAKFDQAPRRLEPCEVADLRRSFRLPEGAPVLVVGSTRQPDEERAVYRAYVRAAEQVPGLALIHAPRHIDRAEEVAGLMREAGLEPVRRTELDRVSGPARHVILDTFGELANVYALADAAYVGNSLTPPGGGQNILQPLAQGKAVIYGPYMQNFRDAVAMAENQGVGFRVTSADELADRIVRQASRCDGRDDLSDRATLLVESNRGVAERYARALADLMDQRAELAGGG